MCRLFQGQCLVRCEVVFRVLCSGEWELGFCGLDGVFFFADAKAEDAEADSGGGEPACLEVFETPVEEAFEVEDVALRVVIGPFLGVVHAKPLWSAGWEESECTECAICVEDACLACDAVDGTGDAFDGTVLVLPVLVVQAFFAGLVDGGGEIFDLALTGEGRTYQATMAGTLCSALHTSARSAKLAGKNMSLYRVVPSESVIGTLSCMTMSHGRGM